MVREREWRYGMTPAQRDRIAEKLEDIVDDCAHAGVTPLELIAIIQEVWDEYYLRCRLSVIKEFERIINKAK